MGVRALTVVLAALALAACSSAGTRSPGLEGGTTPLLLVEGPGSQTQPLVRIRIAGVGPFAFALDTGASQSLVDRSVARRVDAPIVARGRVIVGVGGVARADVARIERWRTGSVRLPAARVAVLAGRLGGSGARSGRRVRGLLGSDVLSRYGLVVVDYERERLSLGSAPQDLAAWRSAPLRIVRGAEGSRLAMIDLDLGGETVAFVLDTGASRSAVDRELAHRLRLGVVARDQIVMGVGGVRRADLVRVRGWSASGIRLPQARAAVLDVPRVPRGLAPGPAFLGLLGSDVLRRFGAVTIDYENGRLWLRGRSATE